MFRGTGKLPLGRTQAAAGTQQWNVSLSSALRAQSNLLTWVNPRANTACRTTLAGDSRGAGRCLHKKAVQKGYEVLHSLHASGSFSNQFGTLEMQ